LHNNCSLEQIFVEVGSWYVPYLISNYRDHMSGGL